MQPCRVEPLADTAPSRRAAAAHAGWAGLSRGDACGLCALWDLARLGVESAKIVGRGTPTPRKAWAVSAVRDLLELIAAGADREAFLAEARRRSCSRFAHRCDPRLCYFPALIPRGA